MSTRYQTIAKWVHEMGWRRGAELGLFDGRTFLHVLANTPAEIIGVDVWDANFVEGKSKSGERCWCNYCNETRAARYEETLAQMRKRVLRQSAVYGKRAIILQKTTKEASKEVEDYSLDWVFIDADHSTEGVKEDIERWQLKLRKGGRLIGHDWNMQSVRTAVQSYFTDGVMTGDDHLWWVDC